MENKIIEINICPQLERAYEILTNEIKYNVQVDSPKRLIFGLKFKGFPYIIHFSLSATAHEKVLQLNANLPFSVDKNRYGEMVNFVLKENYGAVCGGYWMKEYEEALRCGYTVPLFVKDIDKENLYFAIDAVSYFIRKATPIFSPEFKTDESVAKNNDENSLKN